jgi:hypothetical protein
VLTLAGIFHALHRGMASDLVWDENLGLVLALTAYVLWMNFFTLLACIEPPIRELAKDVGLAETGSITRSIHALARKVMQ